MTQAIEQPQLLVASTYGQLAKLRTLLNQVNAIELEILLAQAFDCMVSPQYLSEEVSLLAERLVDRDDSLFVGTAKELASIDDTLLKEITGSVSGLIENVIDQLSQHHLFSGPFFHYEFARIGDDDSIILRRVR